MQNKNIKGNVNAPDKRASKDGNVKQGATSVGQKSGDKLTQQRSFAHGTLDGEMPDPGRLPSQMPSLEDDESED